MIRKRILSLLVCAALLCGVLAGCSTSSGSTAASSSSASASESIPSSTVTADTGKVGPLDAGENSLFSLSDPDDAFAPCLGWGPGVSGCSLKSVIAAASLLKWADGCNMSIQPVSDIKDAYTQWFDSLSADDQQSFARLGHSQQPFTATDENLNPQLFFELTNMSAHAGLRCIKHIGNFGQVVILPRRFTNYFELLEVHASLRVNQTLSYC